MKQEILDRIKGLSFLSDQDIDLGFIDTGSYALNKVVSGKYSGGWPVGRIGEIMGNPSTGKTLFISHAFSEAQKLGYFTVMLDNEFAYDSLFARKLGVDPSKLIYEAPETVPGCFEKAEEIMAKIREHDKDTPIVLAIDSLAGQSNKEKEKKVEEFDNMDGSNRAKEIGQCLRHINPLLRENKALLLMINQIRSKPVTYGSPDTRSGGGRAIEFYSGVCLTLTSNKTSDVLRDKNEQPIGIKGRIKNTKNKVTIPFQECDFELFYETGLNRYYGLEQVAIDAGLLEKNGGWYCPKDGSAKFQGEDKLQDYLKDNLSIREYLINN